ncbi:MAG: hypothetical protein JJU10_11150 [Idiomarina sp.]|nr:hypothetical protein [Idiomarina sp.]
MRMLSWIGFLSIILLSTGCSSSSSVMPDGYYGELGEYWGTLNKCEQVGRIDSATRSRASDALTYVLGTWTYDQERLQSHIISGYRNANTSFNSCHAVRQNAESMISAVAERRQNVAATNLRVQTFSSTLNAIGQSLDEAGDRAREASYQNNPTIQYDWATPVNRTSEPYEYKYENNPSNNFNALQHYVRHERSSVSGRQVCIYSRGATLVLPFGVFHCPLNYNPQQ